MKDIIQKELTTLIQAIASKYKKLTLPLDLVIAKKSVFERRSKALTLESVIAKQGVRIYGSVVK